MNGKVPIELKFEVSPDVARALQSMEERTEGGLGAAMGYALSFYLMLDQNIWPGDSFWIMRGNEHVRVHVKLPKRPGQEKPVQPSDPDDEPKPRKITIPKGWTIHPGGKED